MNSKNPPVILHNPDFQILELIRKSAKTPKDITNVSHRLNRDRTGIPMYSQATQPATAYGIDKPKFSLPKGKGKKT